MTQFEKRFDSHPGEFSKELDVMGDRVWSIDPNKAVDAYLISLIGQFKQLSPLRAARIGAILSTDEDSEARETGRLFQHHAQVLSEDDGTSKAQKLEIRALERWANKKNSGKQVPLPAKYVDRYINGKEKMKFRKQRKSHRKIGKLVALPNTVNNLDVETVEETKEAVA